MGDYQTSQLPGTQFYVQQLTNSRSFIDLIYTGNFFMAGKNQFIYAHTEDPPVAEYKNKVGIRTYAPTPIC